MAIHIGLPTKPCLFARKLITARRGLYASPAYPAAMGTPLTPQDLSQHRCLSVSASEPATGVLHRGDQTEEVVVHGPVQTNSPGMVLRLAADGLGISAVDEVMTASHRAQGELVPVLPDWSIRPVPVYAVTATNVHPVKTRVFLDFVQEALKGFGMAG